ncbi:DMT family transporter [Paenibacillus sp. M-152]|uniref:DMT family transporter n=1 Tax=Paenibacillus sp. M-152 TaxID=2487928 RepID=UPI000F6F3D1C|nr:DMT family transporter [Paenibacillus sp. M-152]AZH29516.1 DMT family transporter [Paenibacillus sp. M-152]
MKQRRIYLFLILANLFWAGNYIFGKMVVSELTPVQMTFFRWTIAICILFPISQIVEKPKWKEVWKKWPILLLMGLLGVIGYNFLLYVALRFTSSLNASLVNAMNPALIVCFAALFLKEPLTLSRMVGLLMSLIGVLLVLTNGQLGMIFRTVYNVGDMLMLAAISVWTAYSLLGRRIKEIPPIAAIAVSALLGLFVLVFFLPTSGNPFPLNGRVVIGILYIGLFPSILSFIFWNAGIREIGASRAGVYMNLITVFTAIMSVAMGNPVHLSQIIGGLIVFAGVYVTTLKV